MLDYILINNEDDMAKFNPYQGEMCCYTGRYGKSPINETCSCSIHRNDRDIHNNKRKYSMPFSNLYSQNIKRSDSYETLQIEPPITEEDLRKAYKKMSLKSHPDKRGGSNEQFIKVNEAYQQLLLVC